MEEPKLAINGGKPVIPPDLASFVWPRITKQVEAAVVKQLHDNISIYDNSGIFGEFEQKFAEFHSRKYALLSNSGTSSILAMYEAIGLNTGDEVLCPVYTFHATISPMMYLGAIPTFCDCDQNGNISVEDIKKRKTAKTKAVIVTHMWGYPVSDIEKITEFCKQEGLFLLEDCSHAHGAEIYGRKVGSFGDIAAWSLQGQKTITGGEGGILLTDNKKLYDRALIQGHYNKRPKIEIEKNSELYKYFLTGMGLKLRAHPLAIAMANEQFSHLDQFLSTRNQFAQKITTALSKYPFLHLIPISNKVKNTWYAFAILYDEERAFGISKSDFVEALHQEGLKEVDIPGSTGMLNSEPLFITPNEILPRLYSTPITQQAGFDNAKLFTKRFIKIPVWTFEDESNIVDAYIAGFRKVCDFIINHKTLKETK